MTEPTIDELLDEFDITTIKPREPDPADQLARDRRSIAAARFLGYTTRASIIRAMALTRSRYDRAVAESESERDIRDDKVLKAYRRGLKTAASICKHTRIGADQVRSSARRLGLKLADGRPKAKATAEVVHRRNLERRARERRKKEDVEACRGRR
jgi:hypothetical protein